MNPYYLIFFLAAFVSLLMILFSLFIKEDQHYNLKETADLFLSLKNLKAFRDSYYLDMTSNPQKRSLILMSLKYSHTRIATEKIRAILKNPLSIETEEVLKSLFITPRKELLTDILEIACDRNSYRRATAIFALGAYPAPEVEQQLQEFLNEPSSKIQSAAAKSLARIGNTNSLKRITELSQNPDYSPWVHMNYLIARGIMDKKGTYLKDIFMISQYKKDPSYQQAIFSLVGNLQEMYPPLNDLYQFENLEKNGGFSKLLEESNQIKPFFDHSDILNQYYQNAEFIKIWDWSRNILHTHKVDNHYLYLKQAISGFNEGLFNQTNTIAAAYFSFQILLTIINQEKKLK